MQLVRASVNCFLKKLALWTPSSPAASASPRFSNRHRPPPRHRPGLSQQHHNTRITSQRELPWPLLQAQDFSRDREDPEKTERYQAEALVHRHMPASALLGIGTYTDEVRVAIEAQVATYQLPLKVVTRPNGFFR